MKNHCATLIALLFFVCAMTACGQQGPLMLPGDPSSVQTELPRLPTPVGNDEEDEPDSEPRP